MPVRSHAAAHSGLRSVRPIAAPLCAALVALSPPGPYRIELHIVRPGAVRPTVTTFTYAPAR